MPLIAQGAASERTHYDELGIARSATIDEVRRAYHRLALQLHPDKCSDADAADRFIRVNKAWETLSKESSRRAYDIGLDAKKARQWQASGMFVAKTLLSPIAKLLDLIAAAEDGKVKIAELRLESERCGLEFPTDSLERANLLQELYRSARGKLDERIKSQDWNRLAREDLAAWLEMHGCSLRYAMACDTVDKDRLVFLVRNLLQKGAGSQCPVTPPRSRCDEEVRCGSAAGIATPARSPSKPASERLSTPKAKEKPRTIQKQATGTKKAKATKAKAFVAPAWRCIQRQQRQRQPSRSLSEPWGTPTPKAPKEKPKAKSKRKACKSQEVSERRERPATTPSRPSRPSRPSAQRQKASTPEKRKSTKVSTPSRRPTVAAPSPDSSSISTSGRSTSTSSSTTSSSSSPSPQKPKRVRVQTARQKPEGHLNQKIEELRADLQAVRSAARSDHPKALPTLVELVKLDNEQRIDAVRQRRLLGELNKAWWRREVHGSVAWHASSLVLKWTARREAAAKGAACK